MQRATALVCLLLLLAQSAAGEEVPSAPEQVGPVVGAQPAVEGVQSVGPVEHGVHHYGHQVGSGASYYSPAAGVITVVGGGEHQPGSIANKPIGVQQPQSSVVQGARMYAAAPVAPGSVGPEQYGQPESASIPANYKPFGSWGLYIGGNPADGYYSSYYKSLGSSVEKQLAGGVVQPASGAPSDQATSPVKPVVGGSSVLRQAVFGGAGPEVYPFDSHSYYTPADLNSGSRFVSPVQAGSQVYGTPSASFEPSAPSMLSYADQSYATTKRLQQAKQPEQAPGKGYQTRMGYVYSSAPQLVAYPVPVGSQIVGSQPGVEGGFQPYGVHAFTRYALKPTLVNSPVAAPEQQVYYSAPAAPAGQQVSGGAGGASYKQPQVPNYQYQPLGFYGYPMSQLHYSAGSVSPLVSSPVGVSSPVSGQPVEQPVVVGHHSPVVVGGGQPAEEAASEKSETSQEKPVNTDKRQKA